MLTNSQKLKYLLVWEHFFYTSLFVCIFTTVHALNKPFFSHCSRYCPAGCRDIAGDISGNIGEGYRDVSTQDNGGKFIKTKETRIEPLGFNFCCLTFVSNSSGLFCYTFYYQYISKLSVYKHTEILFKQTSIVWEQSPLIVKYTYWLVVSGFLEKACLVFVLLGAVLIHVQNISMILAFTCLVFIFEKDTKSNTWVFFKIMPALS